MSLLVTGTIGIDTVETPTDRADGVLGGSAVYFAFAARLFTQTRLVGVVGEDFPDAFRRVLEDSSIDLTGLETRPGAKTFRWHGRYLENMNERQTLRTDLNVVGEAPPQIPGELRDTGFVFLANTHPAVQHEFIRQLTGPKLIVCDTMNLWIESERAALLETLKGVDGLVLNDEEARMLGGQTDLPRAGQAILGLGPTFVVIKKGEHGVLLVSPDEMISLPAFPTEKVEDPTGAGDSFAGGLMGYLAATNRFDREGLKSALARGACVASICIEAFSVDALAAATREDVEARVAKYKAMLAFD